MSLRILIALFLERFRGISEKPHERLQSVGVEDGMSFLDIGCGLGFYSFPASMLVGEKGIVYALDINSEYLDYVAKKAGKKQISNIETIKADACNTGLPDDSVDIVFMHLVLHDIKDKSAALKEFYRVSKPGGKVAIDEGHVMTIEEIKKLAEEAGFKFRSCLYNNLLVFEKLS